MSVEKHGIGMTFNPSYTFLHVYVPLPFAITAEPKKDIKGLYLAHFPQNRSFVISLNTAGDFL